MPETPGSSQSEEQAEIVYYVDEQDRLIRVNEAWDRFADANRGSHLASKHVIRTSLHEAIREETTLALYRDIIERARAGHGVRFNFRCDSPGARRLFEMTVRRVDNRLVEFRSVLKSSEFRPYVELFNPQASRNKEFIRVCGWCKKVNALEEWVEVEKALEMLQLFEQSLLPQLTHSICEPCKAYMLSKIQLTGQPDSPGSNER